MDEINNLPYAKWLEDSLRNIMSMNVEAIVICTKTDDGAVGSGYWNASMADKLMFSGIIQQDAMIETLRETGLIEDQEDEDEE